MRVEYSNRMTFHDFIVETCELDVANRKLSFSLRSEWEPEFVCSVVLEEPDYGAIIGRSAPQVVIVDLWWICGDDHGVTIDNEYCYVDDALQSMTGHISSDDMRDWAKELRRNYKEQIAKGQLGLLVVFSEPGHEIYYVGKKLFVEVDEKDLGFLG